MQEHHKIRVKSNLSIRVLRKAGCVNARALPLIHGVPRLRMRWALCLLEARWRHMICWEATSTIEMKPRLQQVKLPSNKFVPSRPPFGRITGESLKLIRELQAMSQIPYLVATPVRQGRMVLSSDPTKYLLFVDCLGQRALSSSSAATFFLVCFQVEALFVRERAHLVVSYCSCCCHSFG
jgi:hypothetical protein